MPVNATISLTYCNKLSITNNEVDTIYYQIGKVQTDGSFLFPNPVVWYPIVTGDTAVTVLPDGLYQIIFQGDTPGLGYYIPALCNIEQCEKKFITELLCKTGESCGVYDSYLLRQQLKFRALYTNLSYFIKVIVESQSVLTYITPPVSELVYINDLFGMLGTMCGCNSDSCPPRDCGCSK